MRVNVVRSHEMDTPELVICMVAAGLGWTLITPLCVRHEERRMQEFDIIRFPGPQFVRRIYLTTRVHELGYLSGMLAELSRDIMRACYIPQIYARERLCCANPVRDSSRESSMVAGVHEQTHIPDLQDQELASL